MAKKTAGSPSLKAENGKAIWLLVSADIVVIVLVLTGFAFTRASLSELAQSAFDLMLVFAAAGPLGLETATLDERERAVLATLDGIQVDGGRARPAVQTDPLADHPLLATLAAGGWAPPDPTGVDRAELRAMIRRGLLVERDGIVFHPSAIQTAALAAARLLASAPDGFTMSQFREALDVSRKYALPLANELDARGITRRRGDVRIGGPRLPG